MDGFSILIPSWNNFEYLKCCLESLKKHSTLKHQVIVHLNEGDEKSLKYLKENGYLFTRTHKNVGVCAALNLAAKLASKKYIVYMNDDMFTLPGWDTELQKEIEAMPSDKFYLSATMIERFESGNNCVIAPHEFGDLKTDFREQELLQSYKLMNKKDWNGASWPPSLVSKKLWEVVGGYSEEFSPGYYSDPDFSMKLWQQGVRIFKGVGASKVYHFGSQTLKKKNMNNGRKLFKSKWKISARDFYKFYLKIGTNFKGALPNPKLRLWAKIKGMFY